MATTMMSSRKCYNVVFRKQVIESTLLANIFSFIIQSLTQHVHCTSCTFKNDSQPLIDSRNLQSALLIRVTKVAVMAKVSSGSGCY